MLSVLPIFCLHSCGSTPPPSRIELRESVTLRDTTVLVVPPTYSRVLTAHWLADSTELYASTVEPSGDTSASVRVKFRRDAPPLVELHVTPPPTTHTVTYPAATHYTVEVPPAQSSGWSLPSLLSGATGTVAVIIAIFVYLTLRKK